MNAEKRNGHDSRCCTPRALPLKWVDAVDSSDSSVMCLELWLADLSPFARAHELGEIDRLFTMAAAGDLWDSGDARTPIKPIRSSSEIYELRRLSLSKQLRFYHGEPTFAPSLLVALQRHIKSGRDSQQREIEIATDRYLAWCSIFGGPDPIDNL